MDQLLDNIPEWKLDYSEWEPDKLTGVGDLKLRVMLDSGAFTAFTAGVSISLQEYCDYVKAHAKYIYEYFVLDEIGDASGSLRNYNYMLDQGLNPIPVFHYGEDFSYLKHYMSLTDYVSLGGLAGSGEHKKRWLAWMDLVWSQYLVREDGMPRVKVHGLGLASVDYIFRYPWYSIDSTSWLKLAYRGRILVPRINYQGQYDFTQVPFGIWCGRKTAVPSHYVNFNTAKRKYIADYVESLGLAEVPSIDRVLDLSDGRTKYKERAYVNAQFVAGIQRSLTLRPLVQKKKGFVF